MEYILIAFDAKKGRYNRIYLSNLRGVDDDQYKINLDDLERNNFQSTHYYRQKPTVDWIKTVPGKTVCTHATSGNPDAVKEAKRRGLTTRDCQNSQVSDKGRMLDAPTFPGEVLYATIKKPVQVFAYDFFKLRPKDNLWSEMGKNRCGEDNLDPVGVAKARYGLIDVSFLLQNLI